MSFDAKNEVESALKYSLEITELGSRVLAELGADEFTLIELEGVLNEQLCYFDREAVNEKLSTCETVDQVIAVAVRLHEGVTSGAIKVHSDVSDDNLFDDSNLMGDYLN
jgi:hypothetical protein